MELQDFISNFAAQFDETEQSQLKPETLFHDLDEWSSLVALSVIAMVDEEYDVTLKGEDLNKSKTIEDLFNIIKERK